MEEILSLDACVFLRLLANYSIPAKFQDFEFENFPSPTHKKFQWEWISMIS